MARLIENISDTARWVATYRAMESERPDALFRDPYARRLAGERGEQIMRSLPYGRSAASGLIVRTAVFDEMIVQTLQRSGVSTVLNLAAGLDARPYRLPIASNIHWIEVDLPEILAYKQSMLADERPRTSQLESIPLDLADTAARTSLFQRIDRAAPGEVLVVAEGFLSYLKPEEVAQLATDLHAWPSFRWWLVEILSPRLLRWLQRTWERSLGAGGARFQFGPAERLAFFERYGWRVAESRAAMEESHRLNRETRMGKLWSLALP